MRFPRTAWYLEPVPTCLYHKVPFEVYKLEKLFNFGTLFSTQKSKYSVIWYVFELKYLK